MIRWFATALVLASAAAWGQTAQALNAEGHKLYQAKKWDEAITKFHQAIEADEKHALAHYNLAATLALMRTLNQVCEHDAYESTILSELKRSIALDPRRKARALEDSDFASVRDTIGWQLLRGLTVEKNAGEILQAVTWYGPSPGAYGPSSSLKFEAGGKVSGWTVDASGDGLKHVERKGTWALDGKKVTVDFGKDGKVVYRFERDGRLVNVAEPTDTLSDDRDDCSA